MEDFKAFALELAAAARGQTLPRWELGIKADNKAGGGAFDPVTEADREAERIMRRLIEERYPDHGIAGEEFPPRLANGPYCWSLDPIDGTRSFICGMPTWVTLIALLQDGAPRVGLIDVPRLGETYVGDCETAWLGDTKLTTSGCRRLGDARFSTTDPFLFKDHEREAFEGIRGKVRTTRYGHDGFAYARLAAGSIDLVVESGLNTYDYHALVPVVRGAGGAIGNWTGGDDLGAGQVIAAASEELLEAAVRLVEGAAS